MASERVAVLIIDGLGFDADLEREILTMVERQLCPHTREILGQAADRISGRHTVPQTDRDLVALSLLAPTVVSALAKLSNSLWSDPDLLASVNLERQEIRSKIGNRAWEQEVLSRLKAAAVSLHYAPWVTSTGTLWALRNEFPTFPTKAAGVFAGFEPIQPEVMGNSDTGHQQLFNLIVAKQIPTWVTEMIEDGSFFEDEQLIAAMERAREGHLVVIKTMLSGQFGDDGYVHSVLHHLYALLDLYFARLGLPKEHLQLEIALDGRDSPEHSSTSGQVIDGVEHYDFLGKLKRHLKEEYDAVECVSWIFGRQYMDRNYQGAMIRGEYELIVKNEGRKVADFDEAYALVEKLHEQEHIDAAIPPIVIGEPRTVDETTTLINAIFRADRQEPITATLLGMEDFITEQATTGKTIESWENFEWTKDLTGLTMVNMTDYHDCFVEAGIHAIVPELPHEHNILHLLNEHADEFSFLFLGESVKAKHVGMFSRGRRSRELKPAEDRHIESSYGEKQGVANDNDLYKFPQMRHMEVGAWLARAASGAEHDLIIVNLAGPDMIGHLITNHFGACVETLNSVETVLRKVVPILREAGYFVILTSDHGNVEHFGTDHGNNPVLTTVMPPAGRERAFASTYRDEARLFDVAATVLMLLGYEDLIRSKMPPIPKEVEESSERLIGVPLVDLGE